MRLPSQRDLIERFESKLRGELLELLDASGQSKSDRSPVMLDQQSVGRISRIDSLQVQAMAQAAEIRRLGRIRQIHFTLDRLVLQEFGFCIACGEFIGLARLDIDPTSLRCVSCAG